VLQCVAACCTAESTGGDSESLSSAIRVSSLMFLFSKMEGNVNLSTYLYARLFGCVLVRVYVRVHVCAWNDICTCVRMLKYLIYNAICIANVAKAAS